MLMDTREPKSLQLAVRAALGDRVQIVCLHQADFMLTDKCGCSIGIERKTISDFLNSLRTGRLDDQLTRVATGYLPVILIEGTLRTRPNPTGKGRHVTHGGTGAWSLGSLQMKLWTLQQLGARLIWSSGHEDTADTLRVLVERSDKNCLTGDTRSS